MKDTFGYNMPQLPPKTLTEDTQYENVLLKSGDLDPEWESEKLAIQLINISERNYYSVPTEMTIDLLNESISVNGYNDLEDYDIREETDLGSEFVNELLTRAPQHLTKYKEDKTYLTYLGNLPEAPEFLVVEEPTEEVSDSSDTVGIQTS